MIKKVAGIIIKNKKVLYLRKKNFYFFILPGGKIEKGETLEEALKREIMEELSSRIKIKEKLGIIKAKTFDKSLNKLENIQMVLYRITLLDKIKLSSEIIDKAWVSYKNIHKFLLTPAGIKTIEFLHRKGLIK